MTPWRERPASVRPMLASLDAPPLEGADLVYEPKYDGIRALALVEPGRPSPRVTLWSRLGNDKTAQFPDVAAALAKWGRRLKAPVLVDGEIVALDARGEPAGFQQLQRRIHLTHGAAGGRATAFMVFDLLRDGDEDVRPLPLVERRARLEHLLGRATGGVLRLSAFVRGDGRALHDTAQRRGWEGLIVKRADSPYRSGKRTPDWRKLKLVKQQEVVIGGWTEPRGSRAFFGALLLGVYDDRGALTYIGHTGTGFSDKELERLWTRLTPLETTASPFAVRPRPNQPPHWVEPVLVAEVRFTEWTADGRLRHPSYLGLRDDKKATDVRREDATGASRAEAAATAVERPFAAQAATKTTKINRTTRNTKEEAGSIRANGTRRASGTIRTSRTSRTTSEPLRPTDLAALIDVLADLEASKRDGTLDLPDGSRISVTNLSKIFWPGPKLTKGDLLRYYLQVAPQLLPAVADRPLVMKRFPNGVADHLPFYQQKAPDRVPAGVRVEKVPGETTVPGRLIGGNLATLLYMTQIAAISQDPWFSRVQSPDEADYGALDLDPADGVPFARVLDVARAIHEELDRLGTPAVAKTSGASGLHICIPLPPGTPYGAGLLFCQIIATAVVSRLPAIATIERSVRARGDRVYIDYLQNIRGKTLATAYSARASDFAGVSAPLTWKEVNAGVDRRDFTVKTMAARVRKVGDLWAPMRTGPKADLRAVEWYRSTMTSGDRSICRSVD